MKNIPQLGDVPNEKYKKFFDKFLEIDSLEVKDWKAAHLIGYFCKKYQDYYNIKYTFKFNNPLPSKCFEVFQMSRIGLLLSSSPNIIKEYIDWVFENKIPLTKRRITSISFLTNEQALNEYKMKLLSVSKKSDNISRATLLPEQYKSIFQNLNIFINTYGDLSFLNHAEKTDELIDAFNKLTQLGFDKNILDKVI